jgi:hypothetical protein
MTARWIATALVLLPAGLAQSPDGVQILKTPEGLRYGIMDAASTRTAGPQVNNIPGVLAPF